MVDAHVSGACVERHAGSSPVLGTFLVAGKKIHEGEVVFRLSVTDESGQEYDWLEFTIPTQR